MTHSHEQIVALIDEHEFVLIDCDPLHTYTIAREPDASRDDQFAMRITRDDCVEIESIACDVDNEGDTCVDVFVHATSIDDALSQLNGYVVSNDD